MKIIGLTGGSGTGKTSVAYIFKKNGFIHIDADAESKVLMSPRSECVKEIQKNFSGVVSEDGILNRHALGTIVFSNPNSLELLNKITHPHILKHINKIIDEYKRQGEKYVLLDAPTLYESGADALCDLIVAVIAPVDLRILRIAERDNMTADEAYKRINAQNKDEFYISRADYIINNNGDMDNLVTLTQYIIKIIKNDVSSQ